MATIPMAEFVQQAITVLLVRHDHLIHLVKMAPTTAILVEKAKQIVPHVMADAYVMAMVSVSLMEYVALVGTVKVGQSHQCPMMAVQEVYVLSVITVQMVPVHHYNVKQERTGIYNFLNNIYCLFDDSQNCPNHSQNDKSLPNIEFLRPCA